MLTLVHSLKNREVADQHGIQFVDTPEWRDSIMKEFETKLSGSPDVEEEVYFVFNTDLVSGRAELELIDGYLRRHPEMMTMSCSKYGRVFLTVFLVAAKLAS